MKVLVTGSRRWTDYNTIYNRLAQLPKDSLVIEGGANGADTLARTAAYCLGLDRRVVKAQWDIHGKLAGPIRNRVMLDMKPDLVLGFRLAGSTGTTDCIEEAKRRGIPVEVVDR